jgi:hypothetical protein
MSDWTILDIVFILGENVKQSPGGVVVIAVTNEGRE